MAIEYRGKNKARLTVYVGQDLKGDDIVARKTITYINKTDAKAQYREFESEVRNGHYNAGKPVGLIDLCNQVIAHMKRKGRKETTLRGYEFVIKRTEKMLGNPPAKKITPFFVDQFIDDLDELYSPKTVRNTIFFLSECYKQAIKWRMLTSNPFEQVELPPMETAEKIVLDENSLARFCLALQEYELKDFVVAVELALFCGLRRSEIMGLTIESVDLDNGTISISKTRHRVGSEDVISTTKTKKSTRVLALPEFLQMHIHELIVEHKEKYLAIREYQQSDYLILNELGEPMTPNALTHRMRRFEEGNDLPMVTLHGLRHTHATLVNWLGHDLTEISSQLGHSQQSTTLNIYTHMFQGALASSKSIARDMDRLVNSRENWEENWEENRRKRV